MSYLPLARKYRPRNFSDLVGQDGVSNALKNAVKLGRVSHAVMLSGTRGIGKTTTARVYAKALNCLDHQNYEPCDICESCVSITNGNHQDVIEIDGASNTGVDDIRDLRETVGYLPQQSKYKVYIIDEVHMLSNSAFNALLKTLEEPPSHVVFIFATTELNKVPQTIISRCQTYFLQKISVSDITARLQWILDKENITYDMKALGVVAREGHGSMRDALTILDQVIALGGGEVNLASLSGVVSSVSSSQYLDLLLALVTKDTHNSLKIIDGLDQAGVEMTKACENLAIYARHAFVASTIHDASQDMTLLSFDSDELEKLKEIASSCEKFDLNRLFRTLTKCREDLSGSGMDRFILENYLYEWCEDPGLPSVDQLMDFFSNPSNGGLTQIKQSHTSDRKTPREAGEKVSLKSRLGSFSTPEVGEVKKEVAPQSELEVQPQNEDEPKAPRPSAQDMMAMLRGDDENKASGSQAIKTPEQLGSEGAPVQEQTTKSLPDSWKELVANFMAVKPILGRQIEHSYLIEYSKDLIHISFPKTAIGAKSLVTADGRKKITDQFLELYGFTGRFEVSVKDASQETEEAMETAPPAQSDEPLVVQGATSVASEVDQEKTLFEERKDAEQRAHEEKIENCKAAPLTQGVAEIFDATVEDVKIMKDLS